MHFEAIHSESSDAFSDQSPTLPRGRPPQPLEEQSKSQTEMQFVNEEDVEALGAAAPPLPTAEEPKPLSASPAPTATASKTESPSRKKGAKSGAASSLCMEVAPCRLRCLPSEGQSSSRWKQSCILHRVQSLLFEEYMGYQHLVIGGQT